ncbi:MAG: M3 family metallopeptidase [Myxococcota bacterium]|nr:M3 family metallopeptidase [Myxococcota bacterium]
MNNDDVLLAPWSGPHGGVPPFDAVDVTRLSDAIRTTMEMRRDEIRAIADAPDAPTFSNTIIALENAGRPFARVMSLFETFSGTMSDKPMQALEQEMAPVLAAFSDELTQNAALFARIAKVYEARAALAPDEQRLVETLYRAFARRGAALGADAKSRLGEINQRLATLFTTFGQNVLADEESQFLLVDDAAGLPETLAESLRTEGGWRIANTRSVVEPFLTFSTRRDLRQRVFEMFVQRGEATNKPVITEILALRAERARLLGFASHAHWTLDDNMAKTPDTAMDLMIKVWRAAAARVREEVADMRRIAPDKIEPWDYRFYAEKVRKEKFDLDQNAVKPYLELANMRDAMFWVAQQVYGLQFAPIRVPTYHPDVTAYEVTRGGDRIGLWYFDPYARDGKRSGAWMSEYRTQEPDTTPIVSNNANFVKGTPELVSWDDAVTMFHEFGHALHGLLSKVRFPTLAGTNTLRDFVELPSQLHEHWLATPQVLGKFALHYETKEPIPAALVEKIERAKTFNQGFKTVEYLSAAIYDMKIHTARAENIDPNAFEAQVMAEIGMPPEIVMRHRPTQFTHVFATDSYSAGYYSYLWADTLTADVGEAFQATGSYYDRTVAQKLHDAIMSVGNSVPPEHAFRTFRGRDVDTNALMRDRGFV